MEQAEDTTSYKSPYYDKLDAKVEQKYALPTGFLKAVRVRGEASNADQVSSAGAQSVYQIIPATRDAILKRDGVDAYLNPENAADTAGKLLSESLKRNNGNTTLAAAEYNGGTDPKTWGAETKSYVQRVTGQRLASGTDPKQSTLDRLQAQQSATPQIAKVYAAYKAGRMAPEDAAAFEADVASGKVMLPAGMKTKAVAPGPVSASADSPKPGASLAAQAAPQGVLDAYTNQQMSPQDMRDFEQDVDAGRVTVPQGFKIDKPSGALTHAAEGVAEAVSGARRETETTRTLPDWASLPELSDSSAAGFKAAIGTLPLTTGPAEIAQIVKSNFPKAEVRQDEKGNYVIKSSIDGKEYAIKPGLQWSDAPRTIGTAAAFTPAGRVEGIIGTGLAAGGTQAAIEASNAAVGGNFDPGEVALAAGGAAAVPAAARLAQAVKPAVAQAVDAIKNIRGGGPPAMGGEYIPKGAAIPGAPAGTPSGAPALPAPEGPPVYTPPPALPAPGAPPALPAPGAPLGAQRAAAEPPPGAQTHFSVDAQGNVTVHAPRNTPPPVPPSEAPPAAAAAAPGATPNAETVPPAAGAVPPVDPSLTVPESTTAAPSGGGTKTAEELAKDARKAVSGLPGANSAADSLAKQVAPHAETVEAAKRLGIEDYLQPDHVTTNAGYRTLAATLKSVPGSQLKAAEVEGLTNVAARADAMIEELGGTHDLSHLDYSTKSRMVGIHDDLKEQAKGLYDQVNKVIPPATPVEASHVLAAVHQRAADLGGVEHLSAGERDILKRFGPDTNPTYARLDDVRKQINDAYYGKDNAFATSGDHTLNALRGALSKDQIAVADAHGVGELYKSAQGFASTYKGMQDDLKSIFGKQLDKSIVGPLSSGVKKLATGDISGFTKLVGAVPEAMRKQVVASGLTSAFESTGRKGGISFGKYVDWYEGLQRNTKARDALFANLPAGAPQRLGDLYRVSKGIHASTSQYIGTGRLLAAPVKDVLEADNLFTHILSVAKQAGVAEVATSMVGMHGAGLMGGIASAMIKGRTPVMRAADALLNSQEFQNAVKRGNYQALARSAKFSKFAKTAGIKNPAEWLNKARKGNAAK